MSVDNPPIRGVGIYDTYHPPKYEGLKAPCSISIVDNLNTMTQSAVLTCDDGERFTFNAKEYGRCGRNQLKQIAEAFAEKRGKSLRAIKLIGYMPN